MPSLSKSRSMAAGWHFFRNNVPQWLIFCHKKENSKRKKINRKHTYLGLFTYTCILENDLSPYPITKNLLCQMSDPYSPNTKIEHCDPGWPLKYAVLHTLKFSCLFLNSFWSENLSSALLNECSILTYLLQNIKVSVLYT